MPGCARLSLPGMPWHIIFSLGLAYIAAAVSKAGYVIDVADFCFSRHPLDELCAQVARFQPNVIGLSLRNVDNAASRSLLTTWHYTVKLLTHCTLQAMHPWYSVVPVFLFCLRPTCRNLMVTGEQPARYDGCSTNHGYNGSIEVTSNAPIPAGVYPMSQKSC